MYVINNFNETVAADEKLWENLKTSIKQDLNTVKDLIDNITGLNKKYIEGKLTEKEATQLMGQTDYTYQILAGIKDMITKGTLIFLNTFAYNGKAVVFSEFQHRVNTAEEYLDEIKRRIIFDTMMQNSEEILKQKGLNPENLDENEKMNIINQLAYEQLIYSKMTLQQEFFNRINQEIQKSMAAKETKD